MMSTAVVDIAAGAAVERQFFELSSAHTCECSRAPRGAGVAGSFIPR